MCVRNMSDVVADVMAGRSKSGRVSLFDFNTPHMCLFRSHADTQTCAGKDVRGRKGNVDGLCGKRDGNLCPSLSKSSATKVRGKCTSSVSSHPRPHQSWMHQRETLE